MVFFLNQIFGGVKILCLNFFSRVFATLCVSEKYICLNRSVFFDYNPQIWTPKSKLSWNWSSLFFSPNKFFSCFWDCGKRRRMDCLFEAPVKRAKELFIIHFSSTRCFFFAACQIFSLERWDWGHSTPLSREKKLGFNIFLR